VLPTLAKDFLPAWLKNQAERAKFWSFGNCFFKKHLNSLKPLLTDNSCQNAKKNSKPKFPFFSGK
jgi:hypothetical protein